MAQLIVRNIDDELVRILKERATRHGRSAEAEHREILKEALQPSRADFWERARWFRENVAGKQRTDSTDIVREWRDRRSGLIP